ncbi:hypothetical protein JTE90_021842 [Oedothorax gibbosus]|uniref:Transcription cofactor vestigial-like protein 4 n=1 Tax=Oedothorax gibbosus TaxID=931172 RepID=A0AAV6UYM0_9ARAC|nr:hypothetical protein JTE90_021842 [Oedothorax gibbosus]
MDALDNREPSLKELPTRELKLKRHQVRRDSPTIAPVRLRLKNNNSPLNSESDFQKCFSDRSVSSSPESVTNEHSQIFMTSSCKSSPQMNSLPSSPLTIESNYDSHDDFNSTTPSNYIEHEDYDQPLDMSRKRPQEVILDSEITHRKQLRPSVITCASALLRTPCNLSDLAHQMCATNVSDYNSHEISNNQSCLKNPQGHITENTDSEDARPGHRREIVSGSCDPVIDEHFRRSLGKDYQHIFSKSTSSSVSITVDDHFAKALGDTWHQIQQSKSVTAESEPTNNTTKSLQPQQPPPYLQQPPEIFS